MTPTRRLLALVVATAAFAALSAGCSTREFAGFVREPSPDVSALSLPDTSTGDDLTLRARPGGLLMVYFGYTNCPDYCPTTMSELKIALRRAGDPAAVDVAMVTVDPDRDGPILADYVGSFFPGGHALVTYDDALLAEVAAPFGASYLVSTDDDGSVEVAHSTALYAVDDSGQLVMTWPFGINIDEMATDIKDLLDGRRA
ncbi:MAG: SCO family protein [Ilumatobacteraceae bacterium]